MDAARSMYDALSRWANELPPAVFRALVRLMVVLLLATTACFITQRKLYGQIPDGALITVQAFITLLAFLIGMELPIHLIPLTPPVRTWLFCISLFADVVIPLGLAYLMAPVAGWWKLTALIIYSLMFMLFITGGWRS
ncbi:MAG: hypothetical protein HYT62_01205 [Candidatus Yanofskybacteria bacterium]|nr:hypothetical protein [Candidatus Yanofskybacteria bacterium]